MIHGEVEESIPDMHSPSSNSMMSEQGTELQVGLQTKF